MGGGVEGTASARRRIRPVLPRSAPGLSAAEREQIHAWARNLPALWHTATTTAADRQRIVRLLVQEVVVTVRGESEWVDVTIHWAGGFRSDHELVRPVQRYQQMAGFDGLMNRIDELRAAGRTLSEVAEQLNREGFHPPKRSARFTSVILAGLLAKRGRTGPRPGSWGNRACWVSTSGC